MPASVVGRDEELAALKDFLAGITDGASALVLEGEAGMGKTTLWSAALEQAKADGLLVLRAQPAESETALTFSGLGDLLDPVLEKILPPLPTGQRAALSRALVLDDAEGPAPDAHAVGVAVLNALRSLSERDTVVVSVDDVQWLDAASTGALAYASRRLGPERVGLLLARRSGVDSALVDDVRREALGERVVELRVGPLDVGALHQVVHRRLDISLPRPLLAEVHQASGGNPFFALEIVRALTREGVTVEAGRPLPVPDSLHDVVHSRLLALSDESRDFLAAAAAHAHPTVEITEAASGVLAGKGLVPARDAQIVELDRGRIRFTHPLLAAGAYETADPIRRTEIHIRLAELLTDPEARAWQLAAAAVAADEVVASALEDAARHARDRGAPRPAALLLDRARELTPADRIDDAQRRAVDAAYLHFEAGDSRRAETQLRDAMASLQRGPQRAKVMVVLARVRLYEAPEEARSLFAQVIEEVDGDQQTLALAHEGVAACSLWMFERFDAALRHAEVALALAEKLGDDALAADVLMVRLSAETLLGRPTAAATAERALELQASTAGARILDQPLVSLAENWIWTDEFTRARDGLVSLMHGADDRGDENGRSWLLYLLGDVERLLGNLETALGLALEAQEAAEQSGQPLFRGFGAALESAVHASLGGADEARQSANRAHEIARDRFAGLLASAALGHLELSRGRPSEAVAQLELRLGFVQSEPIVEPGATRFVIDLVEALIELGRGGDATELLDWYEGNARRLERASALANCARCRGLLAAQAGDLDAALTAFDAALGCHAKVELPLDRARTLLALGATQRRVKRRREARATLEEALAVFERIGAALWAERARAELTRISGRAASRGELTPAEERVASLVAEGKTNREVAAALFLSDRTVEGHLSHIFGKLGIKRRREVGPALAARQTQGVAAPNTGDSPVSAESVSP